MKKKYFRLVLGVILWGMLLAGGVLLHDRYWSVVRIDTSLKKEFPQVRHVCSSRSRHGHSSDDYRKLVVCPDGETLFSFGIHLHEDADYCNGERCTSLEDLKKRIVRGLDINGIVKERVPFVPVRLYCVLSIPYGHFIKVLNACAEAGLKNFVYLEHVYGPGRGKGNRSQSGTDCSLPHGFPVDLSVRYANRVLVEIDENDTVKVDGVVVEGKEELCNAFAMARMKSQGLWGVEKEAGCVDMLFKIAPMTRMKTVRECVLAASSNEIYHYYMLGQSTAGNRWTAVRLDMARPDATLWGEMRYSLKGIPRKDCGYCHAEIPE